MYNRSRSHLVRFARFFLFCICFGLATENRALWNLVIQPLAQGVARGVVIGACGAVVQNVVENQAKQVVQATAQRYVRKRAELVGGAFGLLAKRQADKKANAAPSDNATTASTVKPTSPAQPAVVPAACNPTKSADATAPKVEAPTQTGTGQSNPAKTATSPATASKPVTKDSSNILAQTTSNLVPDAQQAQNAPAQLTAVKNAEQGSKHSPANPGAAPAPQTRREKAAQVVTKIFTSNKTLTARQQHQAACAQSYERYEQALSAYLRGQISGDQLAAIEQQHNELITRGWKTPASAPAKSSVTQPAKQPANSQAPSPQKTEPAPAAATPPIPVATPADTTAAGTIMRDSTGTQSTEVAPSKVQEFAHGFGTGVGTELGSAYALATEPSLAWNNLAVLSGNLKSTLESMIKSLINRQPSQAGALSHEETEGSMTKLLGMFMKMQDAAKELTVHDAGNIAGAVAADAGIVKAIYETGSAITKLGGQLVKIVSESEAQQTVVNLARRVATNEALTRLQEKLGEPQKRPTPPQTTHDSQGNGGSDEQPPEDDDKNPLKKLTQAGATATVTKKVKDELKKKAGEAAGNTAVEAGKNVVNQSSEAILKNGYYEVNGFKFTEYYYNRLWTRGRKAPSLAARAILENTKEILPDAKRSGFFKYISDGWEMVYNPTSKEVWHLQQLKKI